MEKLKSIRDLNWYAVKLQAKTIVQYCWQVHLTRHMAKRVRQHVILTDAFAGAFRANRGVFRKANQRIAQEIVRSPKQFGVITRAKQQAKLLTPPDSERL